MFLPLADIGTLIKVLIVLVMLGSWVMRLFGDAKQAEARQREMQKQRRRRPVDPLEEPARPVRQAGNRPAGQAAGEPAMAMANKPQAAVRDEVDEFLRQAGRSEQQPKPKRPPRSRPKPQRIELLEVPADEPPKPQRLVGRPEAQPVPAAPAAAQQPTAGEDRMLGAGSDVARHVAEHLAAGKLAESAERLGHDIEQTDERLQERLSAKFEHRLGKLDDGNQPTTTTAGTEEETLATEIRDMIATPSGMQQAIILNEILARPTDRW